MPDTASPSEIAREALRQLAVRRLQPTPNNFRALYDEIAGTPSQEGFPEKALKNISAALPRDTPEQTRVARKLDSAIATQDWNGIRSVVLSLARERPEAPGAWGPLLRNFIDQFARRHSGLSQARKHEAMDRVLDSFGRDPEQLMSRLQALAKSWSQAPVASDSASDKEPIQFPGTSAEISAELRDIAALILEGCVGTLLADFPELENQATTLAAEVKRASDYDALKMFGGRLKRFAFKLQWVAEDQSELKGTVVHLLQLIVQNIGELVADDRWLRGQIDLLGKAFESPLNVRVLDDAERRLKEVIYKQGVLKKSLDDARERLRAMLASFVDHLSQFSASTGTFHERMDNCARRIGTARDMAELSDVVAEVLRETAEIQSIALQSHQELRSMEARVSEGERRIAQLQTELAQASELVKQDVLTGALNRRGVDEALSREVARASRKGSPLCVGLLDVDNFKKLNDLHGHQTGDEALIHLAQVVRDTLRPQDTLGRYGGEEFLILLPDAELEEAAGVLTRLQRELTKRIFLRDNEKILITFSAGVTQVEPDEAPEQAISRADAAMYEAKRMGKNRVVPRARATTC